MTAAAWRYTVHVMDERRLGSRKRVILPVRLQVRGVVRWAETRTEDLSARGFRCLMHGHLWPLGTPVVFELPLFPAQAPLSGTARVVHVEQLPHSDQCSVGFRFSDVSPDALHQLHLYLKESQAAS